MNHHLAETFHTLEEKIEHSRRLSAGVSDTIRSQRENATPMADALDSVRKQFNAMFYGNVKEEDREPPTTSFLGDPIPMPRDPYADACRSVTSDEE